MLRLKVTGGNAAGTEIQIDEELLIGRTAPGEGRLAEDVEISREHARVRRAGDGYEIEDLGSTNGTVVNGRRIQEPQALMAGDTIEVGGTTLVVQVTGHLAPAPEPAAEGPAEGAVAPGPAPAPEPAQAPARLSLRLEVDLEAREASIQLDDASEPIRLVYEDGSWRPASGA